MLVSVRTDPDEAVTGSPLSSLFYREHRELQVLRNLFRA